MQPLGLSLKTKTAHILMASAAVGIFLFLAGRLILLPGLQADEALHAPAALALLDQQSNPDFWAFAHLRVAGWTLPVMHMEYLGSLKSYVLSIPFFVFGSSVPVLRWTTILISGIGILLFAKFTYDAFGKEVSLWTTFLLSTDPSLIICSRTDWGPIALGFALKGASLVCLFQWWKSDNRVYLIAAAFLLGLGIYDKVNFIWFVAAIVVASAVLWLLSRRRPTLGFGSTIPAMIAALAGSAPVVALNVMNPLVTLRVATNDNLRSSQTLLERVSILKDLLRGHATDLWMLGENSTGFSMFSSTLIWPLFLAAIVFLLFLGITQKQQRCRLFPLLSALAITCLLVISTPLQIGPHHWMTLYPVAQIAIALMFVELWRLIKSGIRNSRLKVSASALLVCVVLSSVALNLSTTRQYFSHLRATRGAEGWSDGIYKLVDALEADYRKRPIYCMDWGFFTQACLLSHGSLHLHESFWSHLSDSKPWNELMQTVSNPSSVFVVHFPSVTKFNSVRSAFEHAIIQAGARVKREQTFYDGRGREWGRIIELTPPESSLNQGGD